MENRYLVDKGWDKMHILLDREMPRKEKKRRYFWLFLGLVGLIIAILIYVFNSKSTLTPSTIAQSSDVKNEIIKSTILTPSSIEKDNQKVKTEEINSSIKKGKSATSPLYTVSNIDRTETSDIQQHIGQNSEEIDWKRNSHETYLHEDNFSEINQSHPTKSSPIGKREQNTHSTFISSPIHMVGIDMPDFDPHIPLIYYKPSLDMFDYLRIHVNTGTLNQQIQWTIGGGVSYLKELNRRLSFIGSIGYNSFTFSEMTDEMNNSLLDFLEPSTIEENSSSNLGIWTLRMGVLSHLTRLISVEIGGHISLLNTSTSAIIDGRITEGANTQSNFEYGPYFQINLRMADQWDLFANANYGFNQPIIFESNINTQLLYNFGISYRLKL